MLHPDPFRDIDRLAAQLLGTSPGSARVPLAMPMDLYRSGDHYVLHADLPGVDPDSVDVSVDGGILTVKAQRSERTELDVQWLSSERFTGGFMRRLSLGADIDQRMTCAPPATNVHLGVGRLTAARTLAAHCNTSARNSSNIKPAPALLRAGFRGRADRI